MRFNKCNFNCSVNGHHSRLVDNGLALKSPSSAGSGQTVANHVSGASNNFQSGNLSHLEPSSVKPLSCDTLRAALVSGLKHSGDDIRLDRFLRVHLAAPHSLVCKHIRKGFIFVDGLAVSLASTRVANNSIVSFGDTFARELDEILGKVDSKKKRRLEERDIPKSIITKIKDSIIFQDDNIVAVNKPSGIATQLGTSVSFALDEIMGIICGEKVFVVHRLDKETSGVIVFAKNRNTAKVLCDSFANRGVQKVYLAVVYGVPSVPEGLIDAQVSANPSTSKGSTLSARKRFREATTLYKVIKSDGDYSLLELIPKTGRMHQLRIHCAHSLGTPIVGDRRYCSSQGFGELHGGDQMMLCSYKIKLPSSILSDWIQIPRLPDFFLLKT